jgi:hypothetical protein
MQFVVEKFYRGKLLTHQIAKNLSITSLPRNASFYKEQILRRIFLFGKRIFAESKSEIKFKKSLHGFPRAGFFFNKKGTLAELFSSGSSSLRKIQAPKLVFINNNSANNIPVNIP